MCNTNRSSTATWWGSPLVELGEERSLYFSDSSSNLFTRSHHAVERGMCWGTDCTVYACWGEQISQCTHTCVCHCAFYGSTSLGNPIKESGCKCHFIGSLIYWQEEKKFSLHCLWYDTKGK
jgi:hypothetical protein